MLELLKFVLESPANFFGSITILCILYMMFGTSVQMMLVKYFEQKDKLISKQFIGKERLIEKQMELEKIRWSSIRSRPDALESMFRK